MKIRIGLFFSIVSLAALADVMVASLLPDEALVIVNDASQFPEALKAIGPRRPSILNLSFETLCSPRASVAPAGVCLSPSGR